MHQAWIDEMLENAEEYKHVYTIEWKHNKDIWFFHDTMSAGQTIVSVLWTLSLRQACFFLNEESVENFKATIISPRKVSIVRMLSLDVPYALLDF